MGVSTTIRSSIFVIYGSMLNPYAGLATCLFWLISVLAVCLSGVCMVRCLALEYVVSRAAVARSWGDKIVIWLGEDVGLGWGGVNLSRSRG